jgi:hypothetical protein
MIAPGFLLMEIRLPDTGKQPMNSGWDRTHGVESIRAQQ